MNRLLAARVGARLLEPPEGISYHGPMGDASRPLGALLVDIDQLDEDATIYVAGGPVDDTTAASLVIEGQAVPAGYKYLLEVYLAREVLDVWSEWRGGKRPSRADRGAAVAYYASRDAYLPTDHD